MARRADPRRIHEARRFAIRNTLTGSGMELAHRARLVVEPSGAVGMAAERSGAAARYDGHDRRVIVISGGNLDPDLILRLLAG